MNVFFCGKEKGMIGGEVFDLVWVGVWIMIVVVGFVMIIGLLVGVVIVLF